MREMYKMGLMTLLLWGFFFADCCGQFMRQIPNLSKLPSPVILQILQDEEGYMWYATKENGLCRDNGYQISVFFKEQKTHFSEADRYVYQMSPTNDHRLLFCTPTGVWLLDKRDYHIERFDSLITINKECRSVLCSADSTFWISSGHYIYHFNAERNLMRMYVMGETDQSGRVLTLYMDSRQNLWLMSNPGGLFLYNSFSDCFEPCDWDCPYPPICMTEDSLRHCLWIGTVYGGVVRYEWTDNPLKGKVTMYPECFAGALNKYSEGNITFGICLAGQRLWVSAIDNLYCFRMEEGGDRLAMEDTSFFIPSKRKILDSPFRDKKGNLWIPSYTPSPFIITPSDMNVRRYGVEEMEKATGYPLIADVVEWEDDWIWILQSRVGLVCYNKRENKLANNQEGFCAIPATDVLAKCMNGKGVWSKDGTKLLRVFLDGQLMKCKVQADFDSNIKDVIENPDSTIFVSTDDAVFKMDLATGVKTCIANGLGTVSKICRTKEGNVYLLCSGKGFCRLMADGKVLSLNDDIQKYHLMDYDGKHHIWLISSDGKLSCFDPLTQKVDIHEMASDPEDRLVKCLKVDANGHVWLLTSRFVKEYNPYSSSVRMFNATDPNIRVDYFQDLKIHQNSVCFCGAGGVFFVNSSEQLEQTEEKVSVKATDVMIDGKMIHVPYDQKDVDVPASVSALMVYLTTFNHVLADKISFAYRLSPTGSWNYLPVGSNVIQLNNLEKGNYHLEVMATNEQGIWCEPVEVMVIHRLPAWFETWWAYLVLAFLSIIIFCWCVRLYLRRQKRRQTEEMERKLTDSKFRFFTNVSHELRTPLALIITPLTTVVEGMKDGPVRKKLTSVLSHAQELHQLINRLLSFRKLEMGKVKLNLAFGDMNEFVSQACESFQPLYQKKGVSLLFKPSSTPVICFFDKNILHHVLLNLLGNAQKFTPRNGHVCVSLNKQKDGMIRMDVADTGVGISEKDKKRIFDRFFQGDSGRNDGQEGSGIGLSMVREMLAIHHGHVSVESQEGVGSVFSVFLPFELKDDGKEIMKGKENDNRSCATNGEERKEMKELLDSEEDEDARATMTVLVVEDHDEFRQFIVEELSGCYHVLEASNGEEALSMAEAEQIDVMVSDVMMPQMDGYELCRKLKGKEQTSHIVIILLTARIGQESELMGYQAGAEYYLTKPFDMNILKNRLQSIEHLRNERSLAMLQPDSISNMESLCTSELEKQFMSKLMELIRKNMGNSEYGLENLSSDLCMSYVTAYRKIKALTGKTPVEFIRKYRLNRAAELLRGGLDPVSLISSQVGFASSSYFTRCFMKEYGITPSDYRRRGY